jgi:hypothetical protein
LEVVDRRDPATFKPLVLGEIHAAGDTDGHGEPYAVFKPFRLTAAGWVSSEKGTPLAVTPVRWKPLPGGSRKP